MKSKKFECIKGFMVNKYDGDGFLIENDYHIVEVGDVYEMDDSGLTSYFYRADNEAKSLNIKWKPSIHMPKEAARIFLKVTNVRVEKLQDISIRECQHEGIDIRIDGVRQKFADLWDSTIKKQDLGTYGWDADPLVWVVEFERIEAK